MLIELAVTNLTSPPILCFVIGIFAYILKSDLRLPPQVFEIISMYLLLSIGIKGGVALSKNGYDDIFLPIMATLFVGFTMPFVVYLVARKFLKLGVTDSAALAAHYGSVSAVTYIAATAYLDGVGITYEKYMPALLVLLEVPGILIAIVIARKLEKQTSGHGLGEVIREALTGKSVILLVGGIFIGLISSPSEIEKIRPVFMLPFFGVLVFFMLELGLLAGSRMKSFRNGSNIRLIIFSCLIPFISSIAGAFIAMKAGLSLGGTAIFSTMVASASYIAAPAAIRAALPKADAGIYLTASIGITLPFNLIFGIPIYLKVAQIMLGNNS